jgi:hypothetical protein
VIEPGNAASGVDAGGGLTEVGGAVGGADHCGCGSVEAGACVGWKPVEKRLEFTEP